jgi:hypothetical protein
MNTKQISVGKGRETRAGKACPPVGQGGKYVQLGGTLLQTLPEAGTERDRAGKRQLLYDQ